MRQELLLALEVTALTSLTFARPVLEVMGDSPTAFVARQVTATIVALWALAVVLLPPLIFIGVGSASRLAPRAVRERARLVVHCVLVASLAGMAGWRFGVDQTGKGGSAVVVVLIGVAAAGGVGALRWWSRSQEVVATFLRYAGVAPLVLLGQFVFASETGDWLRSSRSVDSNLAEEAAAQLGEDAPPVVFFVADELPTAALMNGDGEIDAGLYPNLAELAGSATWYVNHTTVASKTERAVPSLVTGSYTGSGDDPRRRSANLFTMLGESHDLVVHEALTDLCPPDYCTPDTVGSVGTLLGDSRETWVNGVRDVHPWELLQLPGLDEDRYSSTEAWIEGLDLGSSEEPPLVYLHTLLPHSPWIYREDGTRYQDTEPHGLSYFRWQAQGIDNAQRRLILQTQATDRLIGLLLDELRAEGLYEDALVVVTADHGYGFTEGSPIRDLSEDNLADLLWAPLLIKEPGQTESAVSLDNVELVDVLPTVAEILGLELGWELDGVPVGEGRDTNTKTVIVEEAEPLFEELDGDRVHRFDGRDHLDGVREARWLDATGPDAVWAQTEHAALLREPVEELSVGEPVDGVVDVIDPASWGQFDTEEPLPLVVYGQTELAEGALQEGDVVAFGLNGRVAALTEVAGTAERTVHGLLLPELYEDGDNELSAYVVEGEPGEEVLRPLDVEL